MKITVYLIDAVSHKKREVWNFTRIEETGFCLIPQYPNDIYAMSRHWNSKYLHQCWSYC